MKERGKRSHGWLAVLWGGLLLFGTDARAGLELNPADPVGFFTNLASRLVKAEMNLDLQRLQIYPTNHYTPAVHRLLQVGANIYEATTNRFRDDYPHLPAVFRPRFTNDGSAVFICGYVEETNSAFLGDPLRDLLIANSASEIQPDDLVLGIPVVMGAKEGLPNFNEFSSESVVQVTRKVELLKSGPGGANLIYQTNQMFDIGISNVFGAEFWNSFRTNYPRPVVVSVTNYFRMALTNDDGFVHQTNVIAFGRAIFSNTNLWPGWRGSATDTSFLVPLRSNHITIPDSVYRMGTHRFEPQSENFERPSGFAFPRWGLTVTNRIFATVSELESGRVVDCVLLDGMNGHLDFSDRMATTNSANREFDSLWATNSADGLALSDQPGVANQILISVGDNKQNGNWQNYAISAPAGPAKYDEIAKFKAFLSPNGLASVVDENGVVHTAPNTNLTAFTPFNPTWKASLRSLWQVNDPLVHFLAADLLDPQKSQSIGQWQPPSRATNFTLINLGLLNERYRPWGGNPVKTGGGSSFVSDTNAYNLLLKDPLVWSGAHWNIPQSEPLSLATLSRVHRGTPWQTLYLKSGAPTLADWQTWTGNANAADAPHTLPNRDWELLALLSALLSTNSPTTLWSVNSQATNDWLAALNGLTVLTNAASDEYLIDNRAPILNPLTLTTDSAPAASLVEAIRTRREAQPNRRFSSLGALLAVPELSFASPFLNQGITDADGHNYQRELGISDEAYESLPVQLLPRLRSDSVASIALGDGMVEIRFTGQDGFRYAVECSTNLQDWIRVSTNQPVNGTFSVSEPPAFGENRCYRATLLP